MSETSTPSTAGNVGSATRSRSNGLAIAGLVSGIVGLFIFEVILGPLAIIFGGIALSRANRSAGHRGMAWAGIVLGVVDIVLFVVLLAVASHHGFSWHVA
jgi:Domain of unknown function (DUF4190)